MEVGQVSGTVEGVKDRLTHEGRAETGAAVDGVGPGDTETVARQSREVVQDVGREERRAVEAGSRRRRGEEGATAAIDGRLDSGRTLEPNHGRQRLQLHRRFGEEALPLGLHSLAVPVCMCFRNLFSLSFWEHRPTASSNPAIPILRKIQSAILFSAAAPPASHC